MLGAPEVCHAREHLHGAISFGLVSVPITVLSATEDHSVRFRRIRTADNGLVRNRYWWDAEDREVTFGEIGRGYEPVPRTPKTADVLVSM
ncbi:hypothetical protein [Streptomyces sp. SD15]